jgi:uncharacterized protein (TIGR03118 family)
MGKWVKVAALVMVLVVALVASVVPAAAKGFIQLNLVSDIPGLALHTDANVVNAWGIAFGPTGLLWVVDNGTGLATVYHQDGTNTGIVVTIPLPPSSTAENAAPTGVVFNNTTDFVVTDGVNAEASRFLFATEDGTIVGWAPGLSATDAFLAVDNSLSEAVYKGIALASSGGLNYLYATNFHAGVVEVFASDFSPEGSFTDPNLPTDYAPFGIRNLGGLLYVTYARKASPDSKDDVAGPGNGFVVVFDAQGNVVRELISHGALNSPWGLAIAPSSFGKSGGALLVGNFGDGRINAYHLANGKLVETMTDRSGSPIVIDGLWGLETSRPSAFGLGDADIPLLFFAAGINDEADGLVGHIRRPPAWGNFPGRDPRGGPRLRRVVR